MYDLCPHRDGSCTTSVLTETEGVLPMPSQRWKVYDPCPHGDGRCTTPVITEMEGV